MAADVDFKIDLHSKFEDDQTPQTTLFLSRPPSVASSEKSEKGIVQGEKEEETEQVCVLEELREGAGSPVYAVIGICGELGGSAFEPNLGTFTVIIYNKLQGWNR